MRLFFVKIFIIFVSFVAAACADQRIITLEQTYDVPSKNIYHEKLAEDTLTILGLTIGKSTLMDVQDSLGKAEIIQTKEMNPYQICYVSISDSGDVVMFEAGPLGGWKELTAFSLISRDYHNLDISRCTASSKIINTLKAGDGLALTLNKDELVKRLGVPSSEKEGYVLYVYEIQEIDRDTKIEWIIYSIIEAIFKNGKLQKLTITKTTSG